VLLTYCAKIDIIWCLKPLMELKMREYLISENLYNMIMNAIGNADAKNTEHGVHLHQAYIQLTQLKPVETQEAKG